jgi:hypothetical protein
LFRYLGKKPMMPSSKEGGISSSTKVQGLALTKEV